MPNCFQLFPKSDPTNAAPLARIDDEMCQHFGVEPHPTQYYLSWFDIIGFDLACGKSFAEIKDVCVRNAGDPRYNAPEFWNRQTEIVDYLSERYNSDCWVEIGRRR